MERKACPTVALARRAGGDRLRELAERADVSRMGKEYNEGSD
jgi:hypothetical protein